MEIPSSRRPAAVVYQESCSAACAFAVDTRLVDGEVRETNRAASVRVAKARIAALLERQSTSPA